jgi:hypothetical protein
MPGRADHYQAAFQAFLRGRSIPHVAMEQAKKALFTDARLKSFGFVVYSKTGPSLLVDVKGRSLVRRAGQRGRGGLATWANERDVADLAQWERVFGEGFKGLLLFIYWVDSPAVPGPGMFQHRDRWYLQMGVDLTEYRRRMRRRSAKWETVGLSSRDFLSLARPLESWL